MREIGTFPFFKKDPEPGEEEDDDEEEDEYNDKKSRVRYREEDARKRGFPQNQSALGNSLFFTETCPIYGPLKGLRQFLATGSPLKMVKKVFKFMLIALYVLVIFTFLS